MIQKVRSGLLLLSVSLLMAHSFVPHHHLMDSQGAPVYHSCAESGSSSLLDFLRSILEQDLGGDHLSKFQPRKFEGHKMILSDPLPVEPAEVELLPEPVKLGYRLFTPACYKEPAFCASSSRGPPSHLS